MLVGSWQGQDAEAGVTIQLVLHTDHSFSATVQPFNQNFPTVFDDGVWEVKDNFLCFTVKQSSLPNNPLLGVRQSDELLKCTETEVVLKSNTSNTIQRFVRR